MRDKAVGEIVDVLFPLFDTVILTAPDQSRALSPEVLLRMSDHENILRHGEFAGGSGGSAVRRNAVHHGLVVSGGRGDQRRNQARAG